MKVSVDRHGEEWNEEEILILDGETTDLDGEFIEIGGIDSKGEVGKNENPSDPKNVIKEYDPFAGDDPVDLTDDDLPF